jgi:hypothetical protein
MRPTPFEAASLAAAAWKIDQTAEAQTALLDVLAQPERAVITADGDINAMTFSPDGKRFVTGDRYRHGPGLGDSHSSPARQNPGDQAQPVYRGWIFNFLQPQ